ncbi:hypothetical protein [Chryseobacterium salivictor]|uniref:Tissue inhibitor of metalloproteinase n=1 Tax=Chryseobacterium salivictor TaxID=2547600 RepID=A0A4P6ZES0_9FLAO|nr:hypothetical protein [Chryseobacterium salivictor]QBO57969.1 hypothetical protein NBC122_01141 [Chryseobacterium salivictor]
MKKLILLFLFLFSVKIFACKCGNSGEIGIQYQNADFVGEIEITKIYGNNLKSRIYKADVSVLKIYKGKSFGTVEISGLINDIQSAACEVDLKVGEKYLIYLSKNDGDNVISMTTNRKSLGSEKYTISACTPKTFISDVTDQKLKTERQVDEFLSKSKEKLNQVFFLDESVSENSKGDFKDYEISDAKNKFAVYKLKVNEKSKIDHIEAVQNFESSKDLEIMNLMKKNFVIGKDFFSEVRNEEVLLILFYRPENKGSDYADTLSGELK